LRGRFEVFLKVGHEEEVEDEIEDRHEDEERRGREDEENEMKSLIRHNALKISKRQTCLLPNCSKTYYTT
jgi:hypothetical protein